MSGRWFVIPAPVPRVLNDEVWKERAEEFDVTFDWSAVLGSDEIDTSTWVVPTGWTQPLPPSVSSTGKAAKVWLGSGPAGTMSLLVNTITTTGGRTHQAQCIAHVRDEAT